MDFMAEKIAAITDSFQDKIAQDMKSVMDGDDWTPEYNRDLTRFEKWAVANLKVSIPYLTIEKETDSEYGDTGRRGLFVAWKHFAFKPKNYKVTNPPSMGHIMGWNYKLMNESSGINAFATGITE